MQIDADAGCLDALAEEALRDYHAVWQQLAAGSLARAHGGGEPDYIPADLKTINPDYAGG